MRGPPGGGGMGAAARCWGGTGEGLRDLQKAETELEESAREQGLFGGGEIAASLFVENAEHVDGLARAEDVDLRLLALLRAAAELQDGLHVDGLDELLEGHGGRMVRAGVGGADSGVEAVGGGLEGDTGLLHLLGGGLGEGFVSVRGSYLGRLVGVRARSSREWC